MTVGTVGMQITSGTLLQCDCGVGGHQGVALQPRIQRCTQQADGIIGVELVGRAAGGRIRKIAVELQGLDTQAAARSSYMTGKTFRA